MKDDEEVSRKMQGNREGCLANQLADIVLEETCAPAIPLLAQVHAVVQSRHCQCGILLQCPQEEVLRSILPPAAEQEACVYIVCRSRAESRVHRPQKVMVGLYHCSVHGRQGHTHCASSIFHWANNIASSATNSASLNLRLNRLGERVGTGLRCLLFARP